MRAVTRINDDPSANLTAKNEINRQGLIRPFSRSGASRAASGLLPSG